MDEDDNGKLRLERVKGSNPSRAVEHVIGGTIWKQESPDPLYILYPYMMTSMVAMIAYDHACIFYMYFNMYFYPNKVKLRDLTHLVLLSIFSIFNSFETGNVNTISNFK